MSNPHQPTVSGRGAVQAESEAENARTSNAQLLTAGSVYHGSVKGRNENGTYEVGLVNISQTLHGVEFAAGIFAGMLGFQTHTILPSGTSVIVVYGPPSAIVGCLDRSPEDGINGGTRSMLGGSKASEEQDTGAIAADMIEGEIEVTNKIGVGLDLLTTMSRIRAGDRAKVECSLIDDTVAIVSKQFRHLDSMGDHKTYHDGRNSGETNMSSYRHEAMGAANVDSAVVTLDGDVLSEDTERIQDIGRWRYTEYIGFIGDLIHKFVTDPVDIALGAVKEKSRAGKSWIHQHADGSLLMQSTAEIAIERVVRIPVPNRKERHDDPAISSQKNLEQLNSDYIKLWNYGKPDGSEIYRTTYQLREYARWLSRYNAFSRMAQLSDEFHVPKETDGDDPSWTNKEQDRERANPSEVDYYEAYATIRIMRDGSIVTHDGYGSSTTMSNGNVQLSAARHLDIEAAGDIRMVAGGSMFFKAKRHIELNAVTGGIIAKSRTLWRAICEKGTMYLRSDAPDPDAPGYTPYVPAAGDPEAVVESQAIMIEAVKGQAGFLADKRLQVLTTGTQYADSTGAVDEVGNTSASVVVDSRSGGILQRTGKDIILSSNKTIGLKASEGIVAKAPKWYNDVNEFDIGRKFIVEYGRLHVGHIVAKTIQAVTNLAGPKRGMSETPIGTSVPQHFNHVTIVDEDLEVKEGEDATALTNLTELDDLPQTFSSVWEGKFPVTGFFDKEEYYWDTREEQQGALIESVTQQHLRVDLPTHWTGSHDYEVWNWSADLLQLSLRVENKHGFGGEAEVFKHTGGESLHAASIKESTSHATEATNWEATSGVQFKILTRL